MSSTISYSIHSTSYNSALWISETLTSTTASAMSRNNPESTRKRILSSVHRVVCLGLALLILLLHTPNSSTSLAWTLSTTTMRSGAIFHQNGNSKVAIQRPNQLSIMAPNRPRSLGLFLSATQQPATSTNQENAFKSREINVVDATLVGDYLMQMVATPTNGSFSWQLHSIKDVVSVSMAARNDSNDEIIWTDGTEATEALSYGLSSSLSSLTPRVEISCRPSGTDDSFDSTIVNSGDEKDLLSLLQILQAQWVASMQGTKETTTDSSNQDSSLKFSRESLTSQDGLSVLFQQAGLLDGDGANVEWVEMMTGSSQIVGRLPRNLVHKFNILHRGIGVFVTKDKPIDRSKLGSSAVSMPELYVHRRVKEKRIFPNMYDMFVGGVSLAGEDAELTAQREIAEELGLSKALSTSLVALSDGSPFLQCLICTAYNRCLVDLFQYTVDTKSESISWQEEEVAWGDFVDYSVIQASADLSMQRAASEGTWPGPYPPIQSERKGVLSEEDGPGAEYDGNWKEWDYVPDGLLVWKAWLEMVERERNSQQPVISFEVEFRGEDGKAEVAVVELSSMEDIVPQSQLLATRFNSNINDMQSMLKQMWADATEIPVYEGPSVATEKDTSECIVELPSGLVLELRQSTIGEDAGLGLFVRKASSDVNDVLQTQGSAFCGYGPCEKITDSLEDVSQYQRQRSFDFMLSDGLESYVWYKGNLLTVGDVLQTTGATAVRSHSLIEVEDEGVDGSSSKLSLTYDPKGKPCYLVPPAERPDPKSLTIQNIGHMCNDLAGGSSTQAEGEYGTSSDNNNLLVLVPRVTVNADGILEPEGMPVLTLAKSVYIGNVDQSMEVGLRYGDMYWKNT